MYEQIAKNRRDSWILMGLMVALLAGLGFVIGYAYFGSPDGGLGVLGVFGVIAIAWSLIGYYTGDKMALAVSGAHRVEHHQEPQLYNIVEEMTIAGGLAAMPAVYVIDDDAPNAFATGRDPEHASIAVTRGLLRTMNREELQGVIAHELSHVANYDIRFATLVGVLVGIIALVADLFLRFSFFGRSRSSSDNNGGPAALIMLVLALVLAIVAPLAAAIVQFAISRRRESLADASAVKLTRNPLGLARALQKISVYPGGVRRSTRATAHLYISNPEKKRRSANSLFATHPPIEERIAALLAMAHADAEMLPPTPEAQPNTQL